MNRSTKIALVVLAVIGLIGLLLIGSGFVVDGNNPNAGLSASEDERMKLVDRLLMPFRADFNPDSTLAGCDRSENRIPVGPGCEIVIAGAKGAPSVFYLVPNGLVLGCYGFDEESYRNCRDGSGDDGPQPLKPKSRFTVGSQPARLWLSCGGTTGCFVTVASQ